ncbi:hypothetical protein [Adhaeretor mobilis]|uniref:Uncharacterized protein n=1 Tax=Adhaeretor mobilis TaxID=1930276 RepID=A0A517MZ84_9BACT|nr:hypothetical protein [Adhaeretor mobilis]QDT00192.1 hypothetical protein HG15A2_35270 [Adhaeretor mobilis]
MAFSIAGLDPQLAFVLLAPPALAGAAWALRIACVLSLTKAPGLWHSLVLVFTLAIANGAMQFYLGVTHTQLGFSSQYVLPAIINAMVLTFGLPVNPVSGLMVAIVHACICGLVYLVGVTVAVGLFNMPGSF